MHTIAIKQLLEMELTKDEVEGVSSGRYPLKFEIHEFPHLDIGEEIFMGYPVAVGTNFVLDCDHSLVYIDFAYNEKITRYVVKSRVDIDPEDVISKASDIVTWALRASASSAAIIRSKYGLKRHHDGGDAYEFFEWD